MKKESKAQRVERIKAQKEPLSVLEDIHNYAKSGEMLDADTVDRLKWYGLYTHNKSSNDEKNSFHMLRVKLIGGRLNLKQLKVLYKISKKYAQNTADFTTRQDIQFHWIKIQDLPTIFEMLENVGLTTQMAAGDCPRNIVACPIKKSDILNEVNEYFSANTEFTNLPRKFKIGISECDNDCIIHEIQDLSFVKSEDMFNVYVGGGLGSNKTFAHNIGSVTKEQILPTCIEVARLFKLKGSRENRAKARVGHLVKELGVDEFKNKLEENLGFLFSKAKKRETLPYLKRGHIGKTESTKKGYRHIGFTTEAGDVGADGLKKIYKALKKTKVKKLALTTTQNFIALNVLKVVSKKLSKRLNKAGFFDKPSAFRVKNLACTGLQYCKLAISETKDLQKSVTAYLDEKFPEFKEAISISFNGCPNSCAHPHLATLGFVGGKVKVDGELVSGFSLVVGAKLDEREKSFALKTDVKVASTEVHLLIEDILNDYLASGDDGFGEWLILEYGK
jgi:sulfite reductase (ferredoxin)